MIDPLLIHTVQIFLAALLVISGINQLAHFSQFKASVVAYKLLPAYAVGIVAALLASCEIIVGFSLVLPWGEQAVLMPAIIFGLYFSAMSFNLLRGHTNIDCGCSLIRREAPLSYWHLLRNLVLIIFSLLLLFPVLERSLHWLDTLQIITAVISLGVLYLSVDALLSNRIYWLNEES